MTQAQRAKLRTTQQQQNIDWLNIGELFARRQRVSASDMRELLGINIAKPDPTRILEGDEKREGKFLMMLACGFSPTRAARGVKGGYAWLQLRRRQSQEFADAWDQALECGNDFLEDEAVRRATEGVVKLVYHQGVVVGVQTEYSDSLLQFLLRGRRPDKYRDKPTAVQTTTVTAEQTLPSGERRRLSVTRELSEIFGLLEPSSGPDEPLIENGDHDEVVE